MPIFEYRCGGCQARHDRLQKVGAAPLEQCPACQSPEYRKQLSAPGFKVGGAGAYDGGFK
ncbi:MAG: zinc ribbon domain-containing protein [Pseudomonadota bacterium]|nr:zinc ribbon domain-containing protein [Pseudomonadota bacterium]